MNLINLSQRRSFKEEQISCVAQPPGAAEFTDCISSDEYDSFNECLGYDTKQYDDEASLRLELWETRGTPSLPLLPGSLWPGVVAPDRFLYMGQIEMFDI